MGTGCGLNNNSCSGTFKFELKSGKAKKDIDSEFLGLLFRNTHKSFTRGHSQEDVTIDDNNNTKIISIKFEFNLENSDDPTGQDGLYVGTDENANNPFNAFISSIIDFGGIPLVKYGGFDVVNNVELPAGYQFAGYQFAGYTGDIASSVNSNPLIRENTVLSRSFSKMYGGGGETGI